MKHFIVICCVLASVLAKDKKISLEDIERDNLNANSKTPRTVPQKTSSGPPGSPTNFGFLPVKTINDYTRQEPKYINYVPPQPPQPSQPVQYYYQQQPAAQPAVQHAVQPAVQSVLQPVVQPQYQQYENVQYVADNSIAAQQQYYTPQYVYLQQYTAPSTAIQTVVDPKGGLQYVMYVPTYVPTKTEPTQQNVQNVVYTNDQQTYAVPETQYITQQQQPQPQQQYIPPPQTQIYTKQEPKSLLDSYVPSILQVQYYKQQQARVNAIQQSLKDVGRISKQTQSHNSAESTISYNYQIPDTQQQKY